MNDIYVPVLRWKRAERSALESLPSSDHSRLKPLLEPTPNVTTRSLSKLSRPEVISLWAEQIERARGSHPVFLDLNHVWDLVRDPAGAHVLSLLTGDAQARRLSITPVVAPGSRAVDKAAARQMATELGSGLAFRLRPHEVLSSALTNLAVELRLAASSLDIVIDCGYLQSDRRVDEMIDRLRAIDRWRSIVLLSGAFPKDLSELAKNQQHEVSRQDWLCWTSTGSAGAPTLFGDYTVQHAVFSEPPGRANYSASIRYAADEYWVVMRGESVFLADGPGFQQYYGQAQLLVERPEYCGQTFSAGDAYISDVANGEKGPGSAETSIRAGISHHLAFVLSQLSARGGRARS